MQHAEPWLTWGNDSHALANSVAFDALQDGADLEDGYIKGDGVQVFARDVLFPFGADRVVLS